MFLVFKNVEIGFHFNSNFTYTSFSLAFKFPNGEILRLNTCRHKNCQTEAMKEKNKKLRARS